MRSIRILSAGAMLWALCLAPSFNAKSIYQFPRTVRAIDAGTTINVRTNESIKAKDSSGHVFSGSVDRDVMDSSRNIVIPKGSNVELVVRKVSGNDLTLDLDSVTVNGQRYGIQTEDQVVSGEKDGLGANKRTGKYVGGGAAIGAIIGAIAGGGKGAAIGAGAGAAAGAGAQVLTRGKSIDVPPESLLTFRLAQPLQMGIVDQGYTRNGVHYHPYDQNDPNQRVYDSARQKPGYYSNGQGTVNIGADNNITWQGPENAKVYVQMDDEAPKLFAAGSAGTQNAPWITQGHRYVFILNDASGYEIARDQLDLRSSRRRR